MQERRTKNKQIKKIHPVTVSPKMHLSKYFARNNVQPEIKAMLSARRADEMHTEEEWKELIKKELSRRL